MRSWLLTGILLVAAAVASAQTIAPPESFVLDGVPKIPAAITEGVGRYTDFRAAAFASWHPQRREMLIRTRFADTSQIHEVKFPGGARQQLTFFPDNVGGGSFCPADGSIFIFSKDSDGNEFAQLYRYDMASGDITLLTDGKSRNGSAVWSSKGDRIAYTSTRRDGKDSDIYVMDPRDPKSDKLLIQLETPGWWVSSWSHDDASLLIGETVSANESYLWLVDTATGKKTALTPRDAAQKSAWGGGAFAPDGKNFYTTTDADGEFRQLVQFDIASGKHKVLSGGIPWDVESFDLSDDGKWLAFVANEDGISTLHLWDTAAGKEMPAPKLPAGQVSSLSWHKNNRDLALALVSARATSDIYSVDVSTGKVERWTESETAGIRTDRFSEPQLIRWKSFDDRTISGFLYRPPAKFTGKRPVLMLIHGGPEGQYRPGFLGRANYYLNELGIALVFPNVRGSTGYGKTFLQLDDGFRREDSVKDIGALLDWIKTRPDLDADRVMVSGGSYGGYMSLAVSEHYAERIRCSLDSVGISNFITFLEKTEAYLRDLRRVEYGDEREPKMREFLQKISPTTNAARITKPLMVVQGANDPRVPAEEAQQIVEAVKKNGVPVWFLLAKDEGHGLSKKKDADFQFYATIAFMQEYLLGK